MNDILKTTITITGDWISTVDSIHAEEFDLAFNGLKKLSYEIKNLKRLLVAETGRQATMVGVGKVENEEEV